MPYREFVRIPQDQLRVLNPNGRPCEVCGQHMHDHEWAEMDLNGFVRHCSKEDSNVSTNA